LRLAPACKPIPSNDATIGGGGEGRFVILQLAEGAIPRHLFADILRRVALRGSQYRSMVLSQTDSELPILA